MSTTNYPVVLHAGEIWVDGERLFKDRNFVLYGDFVIISNRDKKGLPFWINQKFVYEMEDVEPLEFGDPALCDVLNRFLFGGKL